MNQPPSMSGKCFWIINRATVANLSFLLLANFFRCSCVSGSNLLVLAGCKLLYSFFNAIMKQFKTTHCIVFAKGQNIIAWQIVCYVFYWFIWHKKRAANLDSPKKKPHAHKYRHYCRVTFKIFILSLIWTIAFLLATWLNSVQHL